LPHTPLQTAEEDDDDDDEPDGITAEAFLAVARRELKHFMTADVSLLLEAEEAEQEDDAVVGAAAAGRTGGGDDDHVVAGGGDGKRKRPGLLLKVANTVRLGAKCNLGSRGFLVRWEQVRSVRPF
jgi:hypothetical protein